MILKGDVLFALYIDSSITPAVSSSAHLTGALGMTVAKDGNDSTFTLRVVLD